ncbi:caspase family protein [Acetobacter senegalensis]|uniref:caspase family protein n=1 Tax=Acetobacter senegalensis TaxID=446692 RepID=UPI001D04E7DA|nr:caspase family protein [Acetobacter senegalensis]
MMAALVIGNAAYPDRNDLANPVNDANDLGAKLKSYGFEVIVSVDATVKEMDKQLKAFRNLLETHEVGLFFFAGHGMQIEGRNYLLALDTDMDSESDAKHSSLSLDKVVDVMARSNASTKIIVLDACRNNPWERRWHRGSGARGLASVYAPKGTIIGFATSPGEVAYDGVGRNGTYTSALLQHIDTPDCSIETMFKRVRNTVAASSAGKQTSWEHTSLSGEFYFNLSLGKLIDEYDGTALADSLFALDPRKRSHEIIIGLKSSNWYVQNPTLALLDAAGAARMANNSLFVVGRNIYQAACGYSDAAIAFIRNFMSSTRGYAEEKRKALLDGILFEIFFDAHGLLRKKIKGRLFNEVFDLQRYNDLQPSFDFIVEVFIAARVDLYVIPRANHDLAVCVSTTKGKAGLIVDAIYVDGVNVLRPEEDALDTGDGNPLYEQIDAEQLTQKLSEEMIAPVRALKITYTMPEAARVDEFWFPKDWTTRKT